MQGVVWVAARDIEIFADHGTSERFHEINGPTVEVIDTGPRRHGTEILRWLGDRLPPVSFKAMALARFESASYEHGLQIDEARSWVRTSVDLWETGVRRDFEEHEHTHARVRVLQSDFQS